MIKTTIYSTRWKNQKEKTRQGGQGDVNRAALLIAEASLSLFQLVAGAQIHSSPWTKLSLITIHK